VHLVGFIIRIYHDARSDERQTLNYPCYKAKQSSFFTLAIRTFIKLMSILNPVLQNIHSWYNRVYYRSLKFMNLKYVSTNLLPISSFYKKYRRVNIFSLSKFYLFTK